MKRWLATNKRNRRPCVSEYSVKNRELGRIVGSRFKPTTLAKLILALELSLESIQPNLGLVLVMSSPWTLQAIPRLPWANIHGPALCKTDVLHEP